MSRLQIKTAFSCPTSVSMLRNKIADRLQSNVYWLLFLLGHTGTVQRNNAVYCYIVSLKKTL